jgi:hypothetical protein
VGSDRKREKEEGHGGMEGTKKEIIKKGRR